MFVYGECVLGKYNICYNEKIFAFKNSKNSRNLNFAKNKIKNKKVEKKKSVGVKPRRRIWIK